MSGTTGKASVFWKIFQRMWEGLDSAEKDKWTGRSKEWTRVMLGENKANTDAEGGLLVACARQYLKCSYGDQSLTMRCEWDKIDLAGLIRNDVRDIYQSSLGIILEHENRVDSIYDIETEFYKLLHWRAPLKVLVCYRQSEPAIDKRYEDKQALFSKMHTQAELIAGHDNAEYLMLVGQRCGEVKSFEAWHLQAKEWKRLE